MKRHAKLWVSFVFICLLALASIWLVIPKGGRISLKKLQIPYEKQFSIHLGLDLQGGSHLVYQADLSGLPEQDRASALDAARDIIERRVNSFGISEPVVQVSGKDKLVIELPGIKDINEAMTQIGQTPLLEFKTQGDTPQQAQVDENGNASLDVNGGWVSTGLSGQQLKRASADIDQSRGQLSSSFVVRLEFNDEGKKLFADITKANINKQVAIFLDGQVLSAPVVRSEITDGVAIITGDFNAQQAKDLALRLNSGALPVPIRPISQENIGASLGRDSVAKSLIAGCIGLLLVALFMILYYRLPGLLAVLALAIYAVLTLAIFKVGISVLGVLLVGAFFFLGLTINPKLGYFAFLSYIALMFAGALQPVTLTLAGVAGFILSIGMAVDANILIFERVKEEVRLGKKVDQAIEDGFARAWLSIRDSNMSSLITTLILYIFGTPSIKGFALTLGIGIVISMFTAISITRTFLRLFLTSKIMHNPLLYGVKVEQK